MVDHNNITVSKRLVAVNSASSVIAKIANVTVLLWSYQYLLKRIPAEEFAVLPIVTAIMVFAPLFFSFFTGGISRFLIDSYAKGERENVTNIVSSAFIPLAVFTVIFLGAGGVFVLFIDKVLTIPPQMVNTSRIMLLMLIVSFALQMCALPFSFGFHVKQKFVELNSLGVARDFVRIVFLLVLLIGISPEVVWVVVATAVSEIFHTIIVMIRSRQLVPEQYFSFSGFSRQRSWTLINFGLWTTLGRLGSIMYTNGATIVLNIYGSPVDVTSYHLGATFFRQIESTIGLAAEPLRPALTAMHSLGDKGRLASTVFRGGRYALWVSMLAATPLIVYADTFILLYAGPEYAAAASVIILFMIIFPFTMPTMLLPMTAMAMAKLRPFFLPGFIVQLIGLILMLYFAIGIESGALGVTLALTITTIGSHIAYFWFLCIKLSGGTLRSFIFDVLVRGLGPTVGGGIVWVGLKVSAPPETWGQLILYGTLGACAYIAILLTLCLTKGERRDLISMFIRLRLIRK